MLVLIPNGLWFESGWWFPASSYIIGQTTCICRVQDEFRKTSRHLSIPPFTNHCGKFASDKLVNKKILEEGRQYNRGDQCRLLALVLLRASTGCVSWVCDILLLTSAATERSPTGPASISWVNKVNNHKLINKFWHITLIFQCVA